jgi:hypothetical protein
MPTNIPRPGLQIAAQDTSFSRVAADVRSFMESRRNSVAASSDKDAEWQRVHSYIADVLKDAHVLYAKLARLEGDFAGEEATNLERISEAVLTIGEELSHFSKAFYEGKYDMRESTFTYGEESESTSPPPTSYDSSSPKEPVGEAEEEAGEAEEQAGESEEEAGESEEEAGEVEEESEES